MIFPNAAELSKQTTSAFNSYILGLNAIIDDDVKNAVQLLTQAVEADSELIDAYFQLGKLFIKQKDILRGQKIYRDLLLRSNLSEPVRKRIGVSLVDAYIAGKNFEQARKVAEKMVLKEPDDMYLRLSLTTVLERQKDFTAAEKHWKTYASRNKINASQRLALYRVEEARGLPSVETKRLRQLLNQAVKLDTNCAPAYVLLARQYRQEGKNDKVLECWENLLDYAPEKSVWVFKEIEEYLFEINRYDEILPIFQKLSRKEGKHQPAAITALARQYYKTGQKDLAAETILQLVDHVTDIEELLRELITYYLQIEDNGRILIKIQEILQRGNAFFIYICSSCGQKLETAEWHCPQCGAWDSFNPKI